MHSSGSRFAQKSILNPLYHASILYERMFKSIIKAGLDTTNVVSLDLSQ